MDQSQSVSDVLRKALVVSTKLKLIDFQQWCDLEVNGYGGAEVPPYRIVNGTVKAHNPYNGWIPVIMSDSESQQLISQRAVGQPVGELEHLVSSKEKGHLQMTFPSEALYKIFGRSESFQLGMIPILIIGRSQVVSILEAVRNKILNWSLTLEQNGVLGEDLTFTKEEVQKASGATYNIGQFHGVLGNVLHSEVQVGDYNGIHSKLKDAGIPQKERNELEQILDDMPKAQGPRRTSLMAQGAAWVVRNGEKLGALSGAIKEWFE
ncbi:hypothetical protein RMA73_11950 [Xanthomonas translucens pv. translucens]|nr:hypothetical protein [Xanthomonas translucens]UII62454.1 hypothetical protein LZE81_00205 [Xanthomonas translucens]WNJ29055.1 hypothetical protein RMA73_11950 [Xanthomonas translucens pv. translucens]